MSEIRLVDRLPLTESEFRFFDEFDRQIGKMLSQHKSVIFHPDGSVQIPGAVDSASDRLDKK